MLDVIVIASIAADQEMIIIIIVIYVKTFIISFIINQVIVLEKEHNQKILI